MKTFLLSLAGAFVALILFFVFIFFAIAGIAGLASQGDPKPDRMILSLDLRTELPDQAPATGLAAFSGQIGFTDLVTRIDAAADDPNVEGIFIRAATMTFGSARAEELRAALGDFRESGKFIIAHTQGSLFSFGPSALRAVTPADEIWIQPGSDLTMSGIGFDTEFLKGLFDNLSVTAEIEQFYEYKNAPNSYTQEDYTEPHREALRALAESLWTVSVRDIAADRGMTADAVRNALESGPLASEEAVDLKLIDKLGWPEDAREAALSRADGADFLSLADYTPPAAPAGAPKIAVVGGDGPIMTGGGDQDIFASTVGFGSDRVAKAIIDAGKDEAIQALVFRVNSGGGSPVASDQIWNAVERVRETGKPVVVSMGATAASGGYYVSAGADHIFANETTITGSIGIFGGKLAIGEGLERIGVNIESVTVGGDYTDAFGVDRFTNSQRAKLRESLKRGYDRFTSIVAEGRDMSVEEVHERARGRVWSGEDALENGLVDEIGGFREAVDKAAELAGIEEGTQLRLIHFPARRSGFDALDGFVSASAQTGRSVSMLNRVADDPQLRAVLDQLSALQSGEAQARAPALREH
ncbi:MAG: signal peptide peptidase SppA [Alphaproteobacteria bacterium]|nr:signal peptide peptidase SppA [Alphaproteobacteria bacterium]